MHSEYQLRSYCNTRVFTGLWTYNNLNMKGVFSKCPDECRRRDQVAILGNTGVSFANVQELAATSACKSENQQIWLRTAWAFYFFSRAYCHSKIFDHLRNQDYQSVEVAPSWRPSYLAPVLYQHGLPNDLTEIANTHGVDCLRAEIRLKDCPNCNRRIGHLKKLWP